MFWMEKWIEIRARINIPMVHYLTQETMVRIRWWLGGNPCPHITRREEERRRERGVAPAVAAVTFPVALAFSPPSDQSSPGGRVGIKKKGCLSTTALAWVVVAAMCWFKK